MQIVIPMSGFGERFRKAGYKVPKPLIEIDGKAIIEYVVNLFPGETDIHFICSREHLDTPEFRMREILKRCAPTGKIHAIDPHKLGPIHAVQKVMDQLDMRAPTVVNYCDFTCYWDWQDFKRFVAETKCDGCIPAYRGFHPHSLGTTNYAYMREVDLWLKDIQEKQPFTDNRMNEFASSGTYYFASGAKMREAFQKTVEQNLQVGGEFYVSLAYKPLLAEKAKIAVYELQHFMQWGTPQDVAEYINWSKAFRRILEISPSNKLPQSNVIIPMAGLGARFSQQGYTLPKPLIPVSGAPMAVQATRLLPRAETYGFVLRQDMPGLTEITHALQTEYPGCRFPTVAKLTEGQACTAMFGLEAQKEVLKPGPITFGTCDSAGIYQNGDIDRLLSTEKADLIVWGARGHVHAVRHPQMYGWLDVEGQKVKSASVKKPLAHPESDPIILGTFTFRNQDVFKACYDRMLARNARVNNEFYLDTCVNDAVELGYKVYWMDVTYLCWGTPDDLRSFEYWQSCFHKWNFHPYNIEKDPMVPPLERAPLVDRFRKTVPVRPKT